jgi:Tfp pilus assembly protein PilF
MTQDFSVESYIDLAWAYYDDGQIEKARAYNDLALEQDSEYKQALDLKKELD